MAFNSHDIKFRGTAERSWESSYGIVPIYFNNVQDKFLSIEWKGCRQFGEKNLGWKLGKMGELVRRYKKIL